MAEYSPFHLIPLLLPKHGSRLLIVGWHPSILTCAWREWQEIEVHVASDCPQTVIKQLAELSSFDSTRISINQSIIGFSPTAVLVCGIGPFGWKDTLPQEVVQRNDIPFSAVTKGRIWKRWTSQLRRKTWIMEGLLSTEMKPALWIPAAENTIPWSIFSPRGRLERPWMRFLALLRSLRFPLQKWRFIVNGSSSFLAHLIAKASPGHTGPGSFWYHTKNCCLFVFLTTPEPGFILKIPLDKNASGSVKLHHQRLSELRHHTVYSGIRNLLPNTRLIPFGDFVAGAEAILPGVSAYQLLMRPHKLRRVMFSAAKVLWEWQTKQAVPLIIDDTLFEKFWEKPLFPLQRRLEASGKGYIYTQCLEVLKHKTLGKCLPLVPVHGDFWLNNLLCDTEHQRITGILDWDASYPQGLPLLDLFHLLCFRTSYFYDHLSRFTLFHTIKRNFAGESGQILRQYCAKLNIPLSQLSLLFCRYWLGEAARRIDEFMDRQESLRALGTLHRYLVSYRDK